MVIKSLTVLLVLVGSVACGDAALRDPLPQSATAKLDEGGLTREMSAADGVRPSNLRVEHYAAGSCAAVSVEGHAKPILDSCHGWSLTDCDGILLVRSTGVRLDEAVVIRYLTSGRLEVKNLKRFLEDSVERKAGGPYEYLHIRISEPQCNSKGATMAFDGSVIKPYATGSAVPAKGILRIGNDGGVSTDLTIGETDS